jgi:hypothetical protein
VSIPQSYRSGFNHPDAATLEIPVPRQARPATRPQPRLEAPVRPRRRWTWVVGGLALGLVVSSAGLLAAAYVGFIALDPTTTARFVPTAAPSPVAPTPQTPPVEAVPAAAPTAADATSGPRTRVGDGMWKVGDDIEPGRYTTAGADGSSCYYARLKSTDGRVGDIIDIEVTNGPATVVIRPTDGYFKTAYCSTWTKVA